MNVAAGACRRCVVDVSWLHDMTTAESAVSGPFQQQIKEISGRIEFEGLKTPGSCARPVEWFTEADSLRSDAHRISESPSSHMVSATAQMVELKFELQVEKSIAAGRDRSQLAAVPQLSAPRSPLRSPEVSSNF
jgi:hypothetical protein